MKNILNQKYGRLTAKKFSHVEGYSHFWLFKCDCGNEKVLKCRNVIFPSSQTKSCGCLNIELRRKMFIESNPTKSHGLSKSKFYGIWKAMINRCQNKNSSTFYKYGAKGIRVCKRWRKFENFRDDMHESYLEHIKEFGEKNTSIDRIDNNKGYEKKNCRWATTKQQANNKRNNRFFFYNGKSKKLKDWSEELGIKDSKLRSRIYKYKWSIERAFSEI